MEQLSGYEIAQQRIEARQKQRFRAGIAFAMFFLLLLLTLLAGPAAYGCLVPLILTFGLLALFGAAQMYYASPRGAPSVRVVEDQMNWLFGEGWRDVAGTQEFMLAQERIRRRRTRRAYFYVNVVAFFLGNAALYYAIATTFQYTASGLMNCLLIWIFGWLLFLGGHASMVFPSRRRLVRQERQIGQAILTEMQRSTPELEKSKDKPKRDVQYRVGEDGELVEVEVDFDEDEKPKRDSYGI